MVSAIVVSPTDEAVVDLPQRVVVARARASRDAVVHHYLEYLGSKHPGFELEGSAWSVSQIEGGPEAAPRVAYAPIALGGQVDDVVAVTPEVYGLIRLAICLSAASTLNMVVACDTPFVL